MLTKEHTSSNPKFPDVEVQLTGNDGNAFMVMGLTVDAMKKAKIEKSDIDDYLNEAKEGDYDHLLQTTMRTVNVQ